MSYSKWQKLKRFFSLLITGEDIVVSTDSIPENTFSSKKDVIIHDVPDWEKFEPNIPLEDVSLRDSSHIEINEDPLGNQVVEGKNTSTLDTVNTITISTTPEESAHIPSRDALAAEVVTENPIQIQVSNDSPEKPKIPEKNIKKQDRKKETPPEEIRTEKNIVLGISEDGLDTIELSREAMKRHMLIIGMTGSGKTTLLERMILQDIDAGLGVGLIDPHGDLYEKIVRQIPKNRSNDVVLFDLTDVEYPIGFNILENSHEQFPSLVASSIVGVFKKIFGYSWGPRLEYILRNATLTLLENPGNTLLDLTLLLTDEVFRRNFLQKVNNPFLLKFWSDEFDNLSSTKQAEVVSPILNKVGQFISIPLIRNIVSQPQSGFSPRWIMDNKKIFLANLSKGKIGEDVSNMFGSMLVSKFQLDVMSRANIESTDRNHYNLYVDEFQNFATESFSDIFSESRKYGLGLIIAHQYLGQVNQPLLEAILGNVGNIAAFHVGSQDARILAPNMSATMKPEDISEQPLYHFILKTTRNTRKEIQKGELIDPSIMIHRSGSQNVNTLKSLVRDKFSKSRQFVESKLNTKIS